LRRRTLPTTAPSSLASSPFGSTFPSWPDSCFPVCGAPDAERILDWSRRTGVDDIGLRSYPLLARRLQRQCMGALRYMILHHFRATVPGCPRRWSHGSLMCRHLVDELVQPRTCSVAPRPNSSFREWPTKLAFKAFDLATQSDVLGPIVNRTALAFSNRHGRAMRQRSNGPLKATISF
jgi:hypothetical protein